MELLQVPQNAVKPLRCLRSQAATAGGKLRGGDDAQSRDGGLDQAGDRKLARGGVQQVLHRSQAKGGMDVGISSVFVDHQDRFAALGEGGGGLHQQFGPTAGFASGHEGDHHSGPGPEHPPQPGRLVRKGVLARFKQGFLPA